MKKNKEELSAYHNFGEGSNAFNLWMKGNLIFMLTGLLIPLYPIFKGFLLFGFIDLIITFIWYYCFRMNRLNTVYNKTEVVGKHVLFGCLTSLIFAMGISITDTAEKETIGYWFIIITGVVVLLVRCFNNLEVMTLALWCDYQDGFRKRFKDFKKMEKYLTDVHEGFGPIIGMKSDKYHICRDLFIFKGEEYNRYNVMEYAKRHKKYVEELSDEDYEKIKKE